MHNARNAMYRALSKLQLCLLENKPDIIIRKLNEVLCISDDCPGALPGNALKAVKKVIEYLQNRDFAKAKMFIKSAMGYIQRDPMMQKDRRK